MIITKEQQEAIVNNYRKKGRNEFEVMGFIEGMEEMYKHIEKNMNQTETK